MLLLLLPVQPELVRSPAVEHETSLHVDPALAIDVVSGHVLVLHPDLKPGVPVGLADRQVESVVPRDRLVLGTRNNRRFVVGLFAVRVHSHQHEVVHLAHDLGALLERPLGYGQLKGRHSVYDFKICFGL